MKMTEIALKKSYSYAKAQFRMSHIIIELYVRVRFIQECTIFFLCFTF